MAGPLEFSAKLFERLLGCLIDAKRVQEVDADLLKKDYSSFITEVVQRDAATLLLFQKYDKVKGERGERKPLPEALGASEMPSCPFAWSGWSGERRQC